MDETQHLNQGENGKKLRESIEQIKETKSGMEKYNIQVTKEQMILISNALEDVSRFASGQWELRHTIDEMIKDLPIKERFNKRDKVQELLRQVKKELMPELPDNGGKNYNGSEFIGNTYQIYRTILHELNKNEDNVYSSPALNSGNMGSVKIELLTQKQK